VQSEVVFTTITHIVHSDRAAYSFYFAVRLLYPSRRHRPSPLKFQMFILRIIVFVVDNYMLCLPKFVLQNTVRSNP